MAKVPAKKAPPPAGAEKKPLSPERKKAISKISLQGFLKSGAPTFTNNRDGTSRYRNNQNAAYLKSGQPAPKFSGNGQNAAYLKNGGGLNQSPDRMKQIMGKAADKFSDKNGDATKKKNKERPPATPDDDTDDTGGTNTPSPPPPPAPKKEYYNNKDWTKVVGHYFPEKQMKAGGLVRGGGAAKKGRGRGKIC